MSTDQPDINSSLSAETAAGEENAAASDPPAASGLRRSKRNKYTLDISTMLKTGSTSSRDYSPPVKKKWAPRRPEQSPVQPPPATTAKKSPPKRGSSNSGSTKPASTSISSRTTTSRTIVLESLAEAEVSKEEADEGIKPERVGGPLDEGTGAAEEPMEKEAPDLEPAQNHQQQQQQQQEEQRQTTRSVCGGLRDLDIQLPDQLLEEDDYAAIPEEPSGSLQQQQTIIANATIDVTPIIHVPVPTVSGGSACSSTTAAAASSSAAVMAAEHIKRQRKVPLRHLDYTNADEESEDNEEKLFRPIKVEYTLVTDGSKTLLDTSTDHSCPKCPAIFESRVGLTNHLKLHGSNKIFPCELCDFSCTNKKTMRQHRRVHGLARRIRGKPEMQKPVTTPIPRQHIKRELVEEEPEKRATDHAQQAPAAANASPVSANVLLTSGQEIEQQPEEGEGISTNLQKRELLEDEDELEEESEQEKKIIVTRSHDKNINNNKSRMPPILEVQKQRASSRLSGGGLPETTKTVEEEQEKHGFRAVSATKARSEGDGSAEEADDSCGNSIGDVSKSKDGTVPAGFYKKGSRLYDRNTVQCPHCPFRTQSKVRLGPHMAGHKRSSGFVCSICQFKCDSSGILRRHCRMHSEPFKWPPDYVGNKLDRIAAAATSRAANFGPAAEVEKASAGAARATNAAADHDQQLSEQQREASTNKGGESNCGEVSAEIAAAGGADACEMEDIGKEEEADERQTVKRKAMEMLKSCEEKKRATTAAAANWNWKQQQQNDERKGRRRNCSSSWAENNSKCASNRRRQRRWLAAAAPALFAHSLMGQRRKRSNKKEKQCSKGGNSSSKFCISTSSSTDVIGTAKDASTQDYQKICSIYQCARCMGRPFSPLRSLVSTYREQQSDANADVDTENEENNSTAIGDEPNSSKCEPLNQDCDQGIQPGHSLYNLYCCPKCEQCESRPFCSSVHPVEQKILYETFCCGRCI